MERLLITGADGPLGANLALALADEFEVLGLYSRHVVDAQSFRAAHWTHDDLEQLAELARGWQPRWILHCGPLSAPAWDTPADAAWCARQPEVVARLTDLATETAARLTVVSSDVAFCGPRMFHEETASPANTSPWAESVLAMERALPRHGVLLVRTHAYGWSPVEAHAGFAQRALEMLRAGGSPSADGRRHATPILATDLARLLQRAYELRLEGQYHLAGAERCSPFRFVLEMAAAFGLAPAVERPQGAPHEESINLETSLSSKRGRRALEMTTPLLGEGLARFAEQRRDGWCDRVRALGPVSCAREMAA